MAATDEETIRGEIRTERAELAEAVGELRGAVARIKRHRREAPVEAGARRRRRRRRSAS